MKTVLSLLILVVTFALSSCHPSLIEAGDSSASPSEFPQNSPPEATLSTPLPGLPLQGNNTPMVPSLPTSITPGLQSLIDIAKADLAQRLSIPVTQVVLINATEVTWPDSGLGCSQTGMASAQVLTPGYLILLGYNNNQYEYHADKGTYVTYCLNPSPPVLGNPDHY